MMLPRRGFLIWSFTTPSITLSPKPFWRLFSKAASRSGPWVPFVPARWSAWQLPQVALPMNRFLPSPRSPAPSWPLPQPASASAARATTAAAHRDVLWSFLTKAGRRLSARAAGRQRREGPRRGPDRSPPQCDPGGPYALPGRRERKLGSARAGKLVEPALRGGDHPPRDPLPAEAPPRL